MLLPERSLPYWIPRVNAPSLLESTCFITSGAVVAFFARRRAVSVVSTRKNNELPSVDVDKMKTHDLANILALAGVLGLNIGTFLGYGKRLYVYTLSSYMVLDMAWVWVQPECVPAPAIVLPHHAVTLALLSHPLRFPAHDGFAALVGLVEAETWIKLARRHYKDYLEKHPIFSRFTDFLFWPAIFTTRLVIHPWAFVDSVRRLFKTPGETVLVSGLLLALVGLNFHFVTKEFRSFLQQLRDSQDSSGKKS